MLIAIVEVLNSLVSFPIVDLSDLNSIDNFTEDYLKKGCSVDSLVLNAGLQYTGSNYPKFSKQGIELTFAVNHLSHLYLTLLLLPLIDRGNNPTVVITASEVHNPKAPGGRFGEPAGLLKMKGLFLFH